MAEQYKNNILNTLTAVMDDVKKITEMVEKGEYCLDITQKTQEVQIAFKKIDQELLEHHLNFCVKDSLIKDKEIEAKLHDLLQVIKTK